MRAAAAAGAWAHTLAQEELQLAGLRGQLERAMKPGLGGKQLLAAQAGNAAGNVVPPPLAGVGWWVVLPAALLKPDHRHRPPARPSRTRRR